ncbi:hypothetical protein U9M48_031683 [Paspalum notatum var. saurae]|uniref:Uncharacterized protein n=1 Tax=Paspalum notatum var. saurae TaxID=547442 RepID=A0AAQ3U4G3_PASNO
MTTTTTTDGDELDDDLTYDGRNDGDCCATLKFACGDGCEDLLSAIHTLISVERRWEKRPREEVRIVAPPPARPRGPPPAPTQTLDQLLDEPCPTHKDMRHTLRNCRDFKAMLARGQLPMPQPAPPPPPPQNQPPQRSNGGNN